MLRRFGIFSLLTIPLILLAASCQAGLKMFSGSSQGTATRTPFLAKATFTPTSTPLALSEDPAETAPSQTEVLSPTAVQETFQEDSSLAPSLTSSPTGTPPLPGTTVWATASLLAASPSNSPLPPSSTSQPYSSATPASSPTPLPASSTPGSASASPTPQPPTASPPPAATATTAPAGCLAASNSGFENQVVDLINQERADRGLPALTQNAKLRQAARRHSEDMACNDFLSHTGSDGSTLASRLAAVGYSYSWAAENIAAGSNSGFSPASVVALWMDSSGHRSNILSESPIHIGVGFIYAADSRTGDYDAYYTVDLGRP